MIRIRWKTESLVLPKRKRDAAWLNPQPQIWGPRRLPRHAKWRFINLSKVRRNKKAKVAPWLNPQPQIWGPRRLPRHAKWHPPDLAQVKRTKKAKVTPALNPQPQLWGPRRLPRHAKWLVRDLAQVKRTKRAKVAPWLNPQPFTWPSHKRPRHAVPIKVLRYKHKKIAAVLPAQQAAPTYNGFKKKKIHLDGTAPLRIKKKKIAPFIQPNFIPFKRKTKHLKLSTKKKIRRTNTAIIGSIYTIAFNQQQWNWNKNTFSTSLTITPSTKAWNWNRPTFTTSLTIPLPQKSWVWSPNSFTNAFSFTFNKAWVWSGRPFTTNSKAGRVIMAFMKSCNRFMNRF